MLYDFILFGGKVKGNDLKSERSKCKLFHNKNSRVKVAFFNKAKKDDFLKTSCIH